MKKIIVLVCLWVSLEPAFSQNHTIDSLHAAARQTSNSMERFAKLNTISQNQGFASGTIDSAVCVQLLQIAQQLKNDSLLAISYNVIGQYISRKKGDHTKGLEYFFKGIPLAEKANDKRRLSSLYFDIALTYYHLQNNEEHVNYIRKGGENLPDKSHPLYDFMIAQYQRGMATYFVSRNQSDSALYFAQLLTATSLRAKSKLYEHAGMYLSAAAYAIAGDNEMAELFFKKGNAIPDSAKSSTAQLRFNHSYIPFLIRSNRLAAANDQASLLYGMGVAQQNNDFKLAAAGFKRQLFDSIHRTDSAYYYARIEATINAQLYNENNINKLQALEFNEQIRLMEDSEKKQEEALQRKQNIQYALIALGIIFLITLYLLLSRSFITNTKLIAFFGVIALLIVFEFLNLLLHPFLERVTHHNPVLMLLALVSIAALLVPLHHRVEKWATQKLIEKNKKIRLAAARKTIEQLEQQIS